jgi:hypothetical protein
VKRQCLFIADPGLTEPLGHHLGYSEAVALAASEAGLAAMVLAGRGFDAALAGGHVPMRATFDTRYQSAGRGGRLRALLYGGLAHMPPGVALRAADALRATRRRLGGKQADGFGIELAAALAEEGATAADAVLLHSVSAANLAGLTAPLAPRMLVVLRRSPKEMDADDAAPEPVVALLQRLSTTPGLRLSLFADTEALAAVFAQGTGLAVRPVPLPVVTPERLSPQPGGLPHVVFAGGARLEKGYTTLPAAIAASRGRARFTLQSGPLGPSSDPLLQQAHSRLRGLQDIQLTLVETALGQQAYATLIASADLLLLPYDGRAYGARSSGILAEALALGIPAVVPSDCWMADAAGPERAIIIGPGRTVAAALNEALDRLPSLSAAAAAGSVNWRLRHNPQSLLRALLQE